MDIVQPLAQPLVGESSVAHVVVHARGAIVTRAVTVPELPLGEVDVIVPGLSPLSDGGSFRAELAGERQVISLKSALHVPEVRATAGVSAEKVAELQQKVARGQAERKQLTARRQQLATLQLAPRLRSGPERPLVDARILDALATSQLVSDLLAQIDERQGALDEELRLLGRELEASTLDLSQRSQAERMGTGHPTRRVTVRLTAGGKVESLALRYVVPAARWWPVYTLRLSDGGRHASWWLEALVAQLSGEDWSGVALSLSTADLIEDARLPELLSLRLGRMQPPPKKAYRAAPEGLDRMFEGYDRAFPEAPKKQPPPAPPPMQPMPPPMLEESAMMPPPSPVYASAPGGPPVGGMAPQSQARRSRGAPSAKTAMPMAAPQMSAAMPSRSMALDAGASFGGSAEGGMMADEAPQERALEPDALEPADSWLDFDALKMAGVSEARRGRLTLESAAQPWDARGERSRIESLSLPRVRDPRDVRGNFDHRFDAAGTCDVAADGQPRRLTLGISDGACRVDYRCVPREATDVYKEARLTNPFPHPLLGGPVDVYVEGSLLLVSDLDAIDKGGEISLGLGTEERIRLARNARVDESAAGLLGGSIAVESEVTIDLTSSLGSEARVEIVDRVPVTDDDGIKIEVGASQPAAEKYDQAERGQPLRGGLRWKVTLPAGGKSQVRFRYKVSFSGKSEIVGGNRRE